ncbi:hypothetical protein GCM10010423_65000 [Streptomyces levis]|uniref:Uncharacterized protein n=1 Tax=Streptomyces levis TaxID=285566 RepID=A0ABN3P2F5_9ACTN
MATCKVYLSDALPVDIRNAHRVIYFPDQSVHILDKEDRPVFIAAPGRYVGVYMEYPENEEADPKQKLPAPVVKRPTAAVVPVKPKSPEGTPAVEDTQPFRPEWEKTDGPPQGFPPVGEAKPADRPTPGEVKVTPLSERVDGETTHEMNIPVKVVEHQDFPKAPQTAGRT